MTANASLGSQREAFSVPSDIAYFNTANLAPQLNSVRTAGEAALERRGRPWSISPEDWFTDVERLRTLYGRVIGADADGVALVPATSYGFAVAARNLSLSQGQRVLVLAEELPVRDLHLEGCYPRGRCGDRDSRSLAGTVLGRGDPVCPRRTGRCGQRAERALDRRRPRRPGGGQHPLPRNRGSARHRRQPVDWRHAAGRSGD